MRSFWSSLFLSVLYYVQGCRNIGNVSWERYRITCANSKALDQSAHLKTIILQTIGESWRFVRLVNVRKCTVWCGCLLIGCVLRPFWGPRASYANDKPILWLPRTLFKCTDHAYAQAGRFVQFAHVFRLILSGNKSLSLWQFISFATRVSHLSFMYLSQTHFGARAHYRYIWQELLLRNGAFSHVRKAKTQFSLRTPATS